ncbi:MAG: Fe-S cluster assembly protein SufD [Bacteroidota bacterium]|nr:Fe-S cluster assembly protein SufD [Bacteroidota bacterium]
MAPVTFEPVDAFTARHRDFTREVDGATHPVIQALRESAIARVSSIGFPTRKHEEWRTTDLTPVYATPFSPAIPDPGSAVEIPLPAKLFLEASSPLAVFVDGIFVTRLSRTPTDGHGVTVSALSRMLDESGDFRALLESYDESRADVFAELNSAFLVDGAAVQVEDGKGSDRPVVLLHLSTAAGGPRHVSPRTAVIAGRGSRLRLVEIHASLGDGRTFTNARTDISLHAESTMEYVRVLVENEGTIHIDRTSVLQETESTAATHSFVFGGGTVRHNLVHTLDGEGAEARLFGLVLADGRRRVDNVTRIEHARPSTRSFERYKGIVAGEARHSFTGRIVVRPDAAKTDARQTIANLLLGARASAEVKPQLEILSDDVRCTHGATVGRLDPDALFYLRSRGIDADEAQRILTRAFAVEMLDEIGEEWMRRSLDTLLQDRLRRIL